MKLTKQGIRDLNARGYNGRRAVGAKSERCSHTVTEIAVIGWRYDPDTLDEEPIDGYVCVSCLKVLVR